jgi:hypothetical protein
MNQRDLDRTVQIVRRYGLELLFEISELLHVNMATLRIRRILLSHRSTSLGR